MSYINEICDMPPDVDDAICDLQTEYHKRGMPGIGDDELSSIALNDEEEIEGWCADMVSRLGLDEDTVYYFQEVMMRWRDE